MAHPTPHPATTDLKPLPVPPLDDTLDAYSHALEAVLDGSELEHAREIVEAFRPGAGPRLDEQLRGRASQREAAGTNWLNDEWYSSYLTTRSPLTLASNVGFQIAFPVSGGVTAAGSAATSPADLHRAVEFIRRAATAHLAAAADALPQDVDARGNRITMNQWFVYAGGIRHPEEGEDGIVATQLGAADREIGIFVDGRLFALPVSDAEGTPLSPAVLRDGLARVLELAAAPSDTALDFNAPSLLGSGILADLLPTILENSGNRATYERLSDMLFTIDVQDAADASTKSDSERIREATFTPRGAWVYKPLSYQVSLNSDWAAVHVEHSCQDGATLVTAITRMQSAELPDTASASAVGPDELVWDLDDATQQTINAHLDDFEKVAGKLATDIITVPHSIPADLPFKISRDASAQLTMHIAQQLTYGHVRAVYEAVDMREFRAGRTECLRAATPEAVAFAKKLIDGTATPDDLTSALDAHRGWVKRCKSGNGFDRHIQMMASIDDSDAFFSDRAATAARRDFLSTTSIGGPNQIVRYCFAPTLPEGFGISYTPLPDDAEFCVSWNTDTAEQPEEFRANLATAAQMFWDFCGGIH
ncbi:choline/carnitine O-acyltransferase [Corynebacterium appendicis]|uniref:choline/carnitine O-acyltransferase n=1 Tax=Corynebacterium appendicis TaxID=163202 RepID=UPI002352C841|nr:choline/carnitine O-acyltransferase [Corynebacterium appendicis]MDK8624916.1 choline/carnitine O-acyltransferase [Corynebacterium appendicis]